ncbi:MAG: hypothetical protein INR71_03880, partial [Terriglobus roseus]|nr:hypothetical protein [Terriglobus roseus]
RFVALNFVFHPARSSARFKSAEISVAVRRVDEDGDTKRPSLVGALTGADAQQERDFGTQTSRSNPVANPHSALIRSSDALPPNRMRSLRDSPPRFLRHAPHLLFGAISPETLTWNFNLAGSLGVSQGPANATLKPSGGMNGSYKMYEMMRIQGSMRGLHGWLGRQYNNTTEDGEIVWTLEENRLQKSGLPREFTFVMLLTKGSGGYEGVEDVKLELDIKPVVGGFMGISNASFPGVVNNMLSYRPLHNTPVDLDLDVGQRFQPEEKGWGFNFAKLATDFDDFVWLPGQTWSTSEHGERGDVGGGTADNGADQKDDGGKNAKKQQDDKAPQQPLLGGDNTLNLRLILDHNAGRGSPAAIANAASLPYISLRPQQPPYPHSRGPSPLHAVPAPSSSVRSRQSRVSASGSTSTSNKRRSITITSSAAQPAAADHSTATPDADRRTSRSPTLRRRTSRSSLDKEYNSPPPPSSQRRAARPNTIHDPYGSRSPHAHFPSSPPLANSAARPSSWYRHDDSDGLETASQRPPPRTADSNASSQATVVRHTVAYDPVRADHGGTATAKNALSPDAGADERSADVPIERRRSAASGRSGRSARSGRSDGTNGRVSVRQAKVAQTPYPATPTPTSASKGKGEKGDGLRYGDEDEDNEEGQTAGEEEKEEGTEDVLVDVPKLAVPRKSSKRASVGSQLRYVVEAGPTAAVPALPNGDTPRPGKVQPEKQSDKIQQPGKEQPEKEKQTNVVSFNGALQGDGAGWTVNDQPHDDSTAVTATPIAAAAATADGNVGGDGTSTTTVNRGDSTAAPPEAPYRETGFSRSASGVFHDAAEELAGSGDEHGDGGKVGEGEFDRNNVF